MDSEVHFHQCQLSDEKYGDHPGGTGIFYHIQVILSDKQESPGAHGRSRLHTERLGERKVGYRIMEKTMEKIVALAKSRGFVYAGSEIYGGLANTWDYGNLGVELKNNVKKAWWKKFIMESPYNVGVDCAILMNPQTWVASGHLGGFSDPLMDCRSCHERFRADQLIEEYAKQQGIVLETSVDSWSTEQMKQFIDDKGICCPTCGKKDFTDIRQFNLMFKTFQGVTEDAKNTIYLRPETAQGIFVNFKNVQRTSRKKIPFGIGQIGKSFRNEITPEISRSVLANLSRWSWSFSVSQAQIWSGLHIGDSSALTGSRVWASRMMKCAPGITSRRSFPFTPRGPQILNSYSHLGGENCGELLTVQTTISPDIRRHPARI